MIMNTFENYLNEPYSLRFEQMQDLHRELLEEIGSDNNAFELYSDLVSIATKYAAIRAGWQQMTREDKMDKDSLRSSYHNSVIVHFNMLARYLRMQGKEAQWRDLLGYEEDNKYYRKTIGDFGCYIVFVNSICSR
ncbi:hypothetical protein [Blautia obeum]|uniref:hypothetical protein n=1 Tax=Blautia obeum TaxID=40520 RepID=UPI003D08EB5B